MSHFDIPKTHIYYNYLLSELYTLTKFKIFSAFNYLLFLNVLQTPLAKNVLKHKKKENVENWEIFRKHQEKPQRNSKSLNFVNPAVNMFFGKENLRLHYISRDKRQHWHLWTLPEVLPYT